MSLYLEHFGLADAPFRITPHTDFFFAGANRGATLEALIYAVTSEEGIVKVTGEVGSGKTMLCRMLLEKLPAEIETLYLANPSLSRDEILAALADELGLPLDDSATSAHSRLRALQNALVERHAAGRRVVVLIDEAHAMPAESLEEIRLLSNLETSSAKLLQIVLFAQPELDQRLAGQEMRPLRERITQHFNLSPLAAGEVARYLEFRLRAAGYRGPNPFSAPAVSIIAKASLGLSRRINILADKALLAAYASGNHQIDRAEVKTALADARFTPLNGKAPSSMLAGGLSAFGLLLLAGAFATHFWPQIDALARSNSPTTAPTPIIAAAAPTPTLAPAPAPAPAPAATATATPTPAPTPTASNVAIAPTNANAAEVKQPQPAPTLANHLAALDPWLSKTTPETWFIQLFADGAQNPAGAQRALVEACALLDPAQIRAYRSTHSGNKRIGIIYGEYPTRQAAMQAIAALPDKMRAFHPFPRQVARLL